MQFTSRRSTVYACNGMVSSSHPLASEAGVSILKQGGTAMDACVCVAACLALMEPCSTGVGGDAFFLYYNAKEKRVYGINGSGRSAAGLNVQKIVSKYGSSGSLPHSDANSITVPGAVACWLDGIEQFGSKSVTLKQILAPAIEYAQNGFPVSHITAHHWKEEEKKLLDASENYRDLMIDGHSPKEGEIFRNPKLARVFEAIATGGKDAFYRGSVAERIVHIVQEKGGELTLEDFKQHRSAIVEPISVHYQGLTIYETPPNSQGIVALIALGILEQLNRKKGLRSLNQEELMHMEVEAVKQGFLFGLGHISDGKSDDHWKQFLTDQYLEALADKISLSQTLPDIKKSGLDGGTDTVYFCAVDVEGNACSFINSNYMGFGTGILPHECGFTLQNRGSNFSLDLNHPNGIAPLKRPFHTIIPAIATVNGELQMAFGVMGGFMQPQGHVQVVVNIRTLGLDPQQALDMPRFYVDPFTSILYLEDGFPDRIVEYMKSRGHVVKILSGHKRALFGRGQVISRNKDGVLSAGSDSRADGSAIGY